MKFKRQIHARIYTPNMMAKPQDFFTRLRNFCDFFPEMIPEKCGFWSPLKIKFSPDIIETLIPDDRGGAADTLWCQRLKKPRYQGCFSPSYHGQLHSTEYIGPEFNQINQITLISYVKNTAVKFGADLAIIDANKGKEPNPRIIDGWNDITPTTHVLKHWLPDMYWGVVFGQAYVELWGLDHLLETPAYLVEKLSDNAVYIQLSPSIQDVFEKTKEIDQLRENVKYHLGHDAFWSAEKAYDITPEFRILTGLSEHTVLWIPLQTRYTDVFRVPHFKLISDDYIQAENPPENMRTYLEEMKKIGTDKWFIKLSQSWLLRKFDPVELGYDENYSYGDVEEIAFFHKPDDYDSPIEKELFIGGWDRPNQDQQSFQDYAEASLGHLLDSYPTAETSWQCLEKSVEHHEGYSEVYIDQVQEQEFNQFRIAVKIIVFEQYFIKVTFMDYWCMELEDSKELSDPIFASFQVIQPN